MKPSCDANFNRNSHNTQDAASVDWQHMCDLVLVFPLHPSSSGGTWCAPATLFTISCQATETDIVPWAVVHQRFPFVGWARFRHSGGRRRGGGDSISVWGCQGLPVAVMVMKGQRDSEEGGGEEEEVVVAAGEAKVISLVKHFHTVRKRRSPMSRFKLIWIEKCFKAVWWMLEETLLTELHLLKPNLSLSFDYWLQISASPYKIPTYQRITASKKHKTNIIDLFLNESQKLTLLHLWTITLRSRVKVWHRPVMYLEARRDLLCDRVCWNVLQRRVG